MEVTSWGMMARGHQKATRPVHCLLLAAATNEFAPMLNWIAVYILYQLVMHKQTNEEFRYKLQSPWQSSAVHSSQQ